MLSLGYKRAIDYKEVDFTKEDIKYDLILDTKTNRFPLKYLKSLTPNGVYVTVGGTLFRLLQALLLSPVIKLFSKKRIKLLALKANKDLDYISSLAETGKVSPTIEEPFPFEKLSEAIQRFGDGRHQGKIVVKMKKEEAQPVASGQRR